VIQKNRENTRDCVVYAFVRRGWISTGHALNVAHGIIWKLIISIQIARLLIVSGLGVQNDEMLN
jgi:hypothetical protein